MIESIVCLSYAEQQLAVGRQRPQLCVDDSLGGVCVIAQDVHLRQDLVADKVRLFDDIVDVVQMIGKTLEEAKKITNQQIADYLGGLPPQKMHCSVMGREAMEAAIKNYETGENADRNLEDTVLCTCYNVSENEVRRVITENQLTTVEEVTNYTKAGGGCGRCKGKIQAILDEIHGTKG